MVANMKNVVKRYGNFIALDNLNLTVPEGKILGLLGPNGAGKTTTIKTLTGLAKIDSGEITLFGEKQTPSNLKIRKHIGLVTQDITIFEDLSTIENLKYFGGLYGIKGEELKRNIQETLKFIGLEERAKDKPSKFSGGMKRRLNIGASLVHKPKLVIMDEPTVGIDPQSRNHILESTKKLKQNGTTIIYTSHYMEEVEQISDIIAIVDAGRVIATGTVEELVSKIQHEEKVTITAAQLTDDLKQKYESIRGVKEVEQIGNIFKITSLVGSNNINEITTVSAISSINIEKPNLEDVFLTLTGKNLRDDKGE